MSSAVSVPAPSVQYIDLPNISGQPATPSGLDADTEQNLVFVACQQDPGYVYVIDATTNKLVSTTPVTIGPYPHGVAVNSRTHFVFVANTGTSQSGGSGNNTVSVLWCNSGNWEELFQFEVHTQQNCDPHGVAVDPVLNYLYVANQTTNDVSALNCAPLPQNPPELLYIESVQDASLPKGMQANPHGIGVDSYSHQVCVACRKAQEVAVIDVFKRNVTYLGVGKQPTGIGVDSTNGLVYVSNNADNNVTVFNDLDLNPTTIGGPFNGPDRFAIDEQRGIVYTGDNPASSTAVPSNVSAILPGNPITVQNIGVPGNVENGVSAPTELAYLPGLGYVYVALQNANQVAYFPGLTNPAAAPSKPRV